MFRQIEKKNKKNTDHNDHVCCGKNIQPGKGWSIPVIHIYWYKPYNMKTKLSIVHIE